MIYFDFLQKIKYQNRSYNNLEIRHCRNIYIREIPCMQSRSIKLCSITLSIPYFLILLNQFLFIKCIFYQHIKGNELIKLVSTTHNQNLFWTLRSIGSVSQFVPYSYNYITNQQTEKSTFIRNISTFDQIQQKYNPLTYESCYLLQGVSPQICCMDNSSAVLCTPWNSTTFYGTLTYFKGSFGNNTLQFFNVAQASVNCTIYICQRASSSAISHTFTWIANTPNQILVDTIYKNNLLYLIGYDIANSSISTVRAFKVQNNAQLYRLKIVIIIPDKNSLKMRVNQNYMVVSSGNNLFFSQLVNNYTIFQNYTINFTILDFCLTEQYLYILTNIAVCKYELSNFTLIQSISLPFGIKNGSSIAYQDYQAVFAILAVDLLDERSLLIYKEHSMTASSNTSNTNLSDSNISSNLSNMSINFSSYSSSTFNPSNISNTSLISSDNAINSSSIYTNQSFSTENTIVYQQIKNLYYFCLNFSQQFDYCSQTCSYTCSSCSQHFQICTQCEENYYRNENNQCILLIRQKFYIFLYSIASMLRPQNIQETFFIFDGLQLYNYHHTQYTGFFKKALDYMNFLEDNCWTIFPVIQLQNWIHEPFDLPSYNAYTNRKFLEVQRSDSIFVQNTKKFFLVYVPISALVFLLLNQIFYRFSQYQMSSYVRIYSFWLYFCVIIVSQNTHSLVLYSMVHLQNLFSLSLSLYFVHAFSILAIGILLLCLVLLLPFSIYFYKNLAKYFLYNVFFCKGCYMLTFIRFTLKPILQSIINVLLYSHPKQQIICLTVISILSVTFVVFLEFRAGIFKIKGILWSQCVIQCTIIILNVLLFLKHYSQIGNQILDVLEFSIQTTLYNFIWMIFLNMLYPIFRMIITKLFNTFKQNNLISQKFIQLKKQILEHKKPDNQIKTIVSLRFQNDQKIIYRQIKLSNRLNLNQYQNIFDNQIKSKSELESQEKPEKMPVL